MVAYESQNVLSLECGNCRDLAHAPTLMQCFIYVKVNLEKKFWFFSPTEKFQFLILARNTIMVQHLIIHFLLHYLPSGHLQEVKNKGKFQTFGSKSGRGRLREVVAYKRFQTY